MLKDRTLTKPSLVRLSSRFYKHFSVHENPWVNVTSILLYFVKILNIFEQSKCCENSYLKIHENIQMILAYPLTKLLGKYIC